MIGGVCKVKGVCGRGGSAMRERDRERLDGEINSFSRQTDTSTPVDVGWDR